MGGVSDRMQEIRRRRHRKKKFAALERKLGKATASDKLAMAEKLRRLTPGAEVVIARLGLEER
jgi:hypothetical protein